MRLPRTVLLVLSIIVLSVTPQFTKADTKIEEVAPEDIEIVGFDENCGDNSICDPKINLICVYPKSKEGGRCRCDNNQLYLYSKEEKKCVKINLDEDYDDYEDEDHKSDASVADEDNKLKYKIDKNGVILDSNPDGKPVGNDTVWPEDEEEWQLPEFVNGTLLDIGSGSSSSSEEDESSASDAKEDTIPQNSDDTKDKPESNVIDTDTKSKSSDPKPEKVVQEDQDHENDKEYDPSWSDSDSVEYDNGDDHIEDKGWIPSQYGDNDSGDQVIKCTKNSDCTSSRLGKHSQCNTDYGTCDCFDTEGRQREVFVLNGTCFFYKTINSECTTHSECDSVIRGPAWCHTEPDTQQRYCSCQPFVAWDPELKECLPYGTNGLESPCKVDAQCTPREALGLLSRCLEVTGLCECIPPTDGDSRTISFFEGKCVQERNLDDGCRTDQDCRAGLGPWAYCHPGTNSCSCQEGQMCSKFLVRPAMSAFTMLVLLAIVTSILIGGILCIVLKRQGMGNEKYSFLNQRSDA